MMALVRFPTIAWSRTEKHQKVLAVLTLLEKHQGYQELPLYAIHAAVSRIGGLARKFNFVEEPAPFSVRLGKELDGLVSKGRLQTFTIFDNGYYPETVYKLSMAGRSEGELCIPRLPPNAETEIETLTKTIQRQSLLSREKRLAQIQGFIAKT